MQHGVERTADFGALQDDHLRYNNALADAVADLGEPERIAGMFAGFQKYLYSGDAVTRGGQSANPAL